MMRRSLGNICVQRSRLTTSLGILGAAALAVACGSDQGDSSGVSKSELTASSCQIGGECKLSYELPAGVQYDQVVLVAHQQLDLGNNARVQLANGELAPVADTGTGSTVVKTGAHVASVASRGSVLLESGAVSTGLVRGSAVTIQNTASAAGTAGPVAEPGTVTLTTQYPAQGAPGRNLDPGAAPWAPQPGRYGAISVKRDSTLTLSSGAYYLDELRVETGGHLVIDASQGTVVVYLRGAFVQRGSIRYLGDQGDALFACFGQDDVLLEGEFHGTVTAPLARVIIGPNNNTANTVYRGLFFGREVTVRPNITIERHRITGKGPGGEGLHSTMSGGSSTLPGTIPNPAGMTPTDYNTAIGNLIDAMATNGYHGPSVQFAAHPDYTGVERNIPDDIRTSVPNPPNAAPPGGETPQLTNVVPQVLAEFPEAAAGYVSQPTTPAFCPLGTEAGKFPGNGSVEGTADVTPLSESFGAPRPNSPPDFDAWFGGRMTGSYGADYAAGLHGDLNSDFQAGFRLFGFDFNLLEAYAAAHGQSKVPTDPNVHQLSGSASYAVMEGLIDHNEWEYGYTMQPLRGDFCKDCSAMLLARPFEIPFGIVTISLNAGLEASLPFGIEPTANGPQATIAPMLRAYAVITATAGKGIEVGAEGEVDALRVDMPVRAVARFERNLSPSVCAATISPRVDTHLMMSTLNGKVDLIGRIDTGVDYIEIFRWNLFDWKGLEFNTPPKTVTFPQLDVPLSQDQCFLEQEGCKTAPAQLITPGVLTSSNPATNLTIPAGDYWDPQSACPGQYLMEIPASQLTANRLLIEAGWQPGAPESQNGSGTESCDYQRAVVTVFGRTTPNAPWDIVDFRTLQGVANATGTQCGMVVVDAGDGDEAATGPTATRMQIKANKYQGGVRLAVTAAKSCNALPLRLYLSASNF